MRDKNEEYLVIIMYIILVAAMIFCAIENMENPWRILYISLIILVSFSLKQLFIQVQYRKKFIFYSLILLDIVLTSYLSFVSLGTSYKIFYYVILYEIIFYMKSKSALLLCTSFYILDVVLKYMTTDKLEAYIFLKYIIYEFPQFLLAVVLLFLVKYIIQVNKDLFVTRNKLEVSNAKLKDAYKNLKEAYKRNEDYAVMQEKNKLAREIHDTVGHTLTTALVEMEATKIFMEKKSSEEANQKLGAAISQVRKGLNEVRNSVSTLSSKDMDYNSEMIQLMDGVKSHTNIVIRYDLDDINAEGEEIKKCVFRALQEGITNSIRHGGATAILFKLKYADGWLKFSLEDNGKGCSFYNKGFGLSSMEDRVKEAGGEISIMTEPGEGFNIYIKFKKEVIYD